MVSSCSSLIALVLLVEGACFDGRGCLFCLARAVYGVDGMSTVMVLVCERLVFWVSVLVCGKCYAELYEWVGGGGAAATCLPLWIKRTQKSHALQATIPQASLST